MTREKAKQLFIRNKNINTLSKINGIEIIDKIFDDFENRICRNCKWFYIDEDFNRPITRCKLGCAEEIIGAGFQKVSELFGCNKFERIEK